MGYWVTSEVQTLEGNYQSIVATTIPTSRKSRNIINNTNCRVCISVYEYTIDHAIAETIILCQILAQVCYVYSLWTYRKDTLQSKWEWLGRLLPRYFWFLQMQTSISWTVCDVNLIEHTFMKVYIPVPITDRLWEWQSFWRRKVLNTLLGARHR